MTAALAAQLCLTAWATAVVLGWDLRRRWERWTWSRRVAAELTAEHAAHTARIDWDAFLAEVRAALEAKHAAGGA
jgi:hypothetical protein